MRATEIAESVRARVRPQVGTEQDVLVTELASDGEHLVGHTKAYVQVLLPHQPSWLGCTLRVRITQTAKFYVRGEVLEVLHAAPAPEIAARVWHSPMKNGTKPPVAVQPVRADAKGAPKAEAGGCGGGECCGARRTVRGTRCSEADFRRPSVLGGGERR